MARDIIDSLIAMRERLDSSIAEEEARARKLADLISTADAEIEKARLADEARLAMADALALLRKAQFHADHAAQVAAVKDRLRRQIAGAA